MDQMSYPYLSSCTVVKIEHQRRRQPHSAKMSSGRVNFIYRRFITMLSVGIKRMQGRQKTCTDEKSVKLAKNEIYGTTLQMHISSIAGVTFNVHVYAVTLISMKLTRRIQKEC